MLGALAEMNIRRRWLGDVPPTLYAAMGDALSQGVNVTPSLSPPTPQVAGSWGNAVSVADFIVPNFDQCAIASNPRVYGRRG